MSVHASLANIVFPLLLTPYAMALLAPAFGIGALVGELLTYCALQFRRASLWALFFSALAANVISTAIGYPLAAYLPSPLAFGKTLAVCSFVAMWSLSIAIEYCAFRAIARWTPLPRLLLSVVVANSVSYAVLMFAMVDSWV